jgi:hypothetical protein
MSRRQMTKKAVDVAGCFLFRFTFHISHFTYTPPFDPNTIVLPVTRLLPVSLPDRRNPRQVFEIIDISIAVLHLLEISC